jgi:hypothetical protein
MFVPFRIKWELLISDSIYGWLSSRTPPWVAMMFCNLFREKQKNPVRVDFPASIECLLVAGNEALQSGMMNTWNKTKSIELLQFYGEDDGTDNESEYTSSSRARRIRLAKKIGVTSPQLNFAQLSL